MLPRPNEESQTDNRGEECRKGKSCCKEELKEIWSRPHGSLTVERDFCVRLIGYMVVVVYKVVVFF